MPVKRWIGNRNEFDGTTEISLRSGTLRLLLGVADRDTASLTDEELSSLTPRFIFTDGEDGPDPPIRRQLYVDGDGDTYVKLSGQYFDQPLSVESRSPATVYYSSVVGALSPVAAAQAAITAAGVGGTVVWDPANPIDLLGTVLAPLSAQTHLGDGATSEFTSTVAQTAAFYTEAACSDVVFDGLVFRGGVTERPTAPQRNRAGTTASFQTAIKSAGNLAVGNVNEQHRWTVRNCRFIDIASLPVFFIGVRGWCHFEGNYVRNCLDTGFIFNEYVRAVDNEVWYSADNGLSVSRGNQAGLVAGNRVYGAAYDGIWLSGFESDLGPTHIRCAHNYIEDSGLHGISASRGPQYLVIADNTINGVRWGPGDLLPNDNLSGVGIVLGGTASAGVAVAYAEECRIVRNIVLNPARGGILLDRSCRGTEVSDNYIENPGSEFLSDGTTAISDTDFTNNFGIWTGALPATITKTRLRDNGVRDTRGTSRTNYPINVSSSNLVDHTDNWSDGVIHPYSDGSQTRLGAWQFASEVVGTGGFRAGSVSGAGTTVPFKSTGAAGSRRSGLQLLTGTLARWGVEGSSDAEAGADVGTRFQVRSYDDAGALIKTLLEAKRQGGVKMCLDTFAATIPFYKSGGLTASTTHTLNHVCGTPRAVAARKCRIIGMTYLVGLNGGNTTVTAGQTTATVQKNGSNTTVTAVITAGNYKGLYTVEFKDAIQFAAGDDLTVIVTQDGSYIGSGSIVAQVQIILAEEL